MSASPTWRRPLTEDQEAVVDLVADELVLRNHKFVDGVLLRQRLTRGDRTERRQLIHSLVPTFLYPSGGDAFALTPFGGRRSRHSTLLTDLAGQMRAFVRSTFDRCPQFGEFTWESLRSVVRIDGRCLQDSDLECSRFALGCVGVWGFSGHVWARPTPERLEDLLDAIELEEIISRAQTTLIQELQRGAALNGNVADLQLLKSDDDAPGPKPIMGNYDTQQVCLNGHQTTAVYHKKPELHQDFCDKCGAKTIHSCPQCQSEIRGHYYQKNVINLAGTDVPANCHSCGAPYPWTTRSKEMDPITQVKADPREIVRGIIRRFHLVVRQLRKRHGERSTLIVADEYDVQDLLHAMLCVSFDDIRPEEYTPSYAGKSSRMDFLLKPEAIVIEVKMTRPGLTSREVGSQLIEDIARYREHPGCRSLVCFVYDPDGLVSNPRGLEADLSRKDGGIEVEVLIVPQGH